MGAPHSFHPKGFAKVDGLFVNVKLKGSMIRVGSWEMGDSGLMEEFDPRILARHLSSLSKLSPPSFLYLLLDQVYLLSLKLRLMRVDLFMQSQKAMDLEVLMGLPLNFLEDVSFSLKSPMMIQVLGGLSLIELGNS